MIPDDFYIGTRRQLRGVAESLVAGPQYRSAGTIRLAVRAGGFAAVALPVAVHGTDLVLPTGAIPLTGSVNSVAEMAGIDAGPPQGAYEIVDPLAPDAELTLDEECAEWLHRSLYAGGEALKSFLPESDTVLWPEHFDVAATAGEVNYGVAAGDDYHPLPYAYVGPWQVPNGTFWNAPFGAVHPLDRAADVAGLGGGIADFFERGRSRLRI